MPSMLIAQLTLAAALCAQAKSPVEAPRAAEPGLVVDLIAAEPEIVTPVGLAVDEQGRVIVVESHTHFRPEGYEGPPEDRLRMFEDRDGDGRYETVSTLHAGGRATMNVHVEADGSLLVATRSELYRLRRGEGGTVTARETLARLNTEGDYPHDGLSGIATELDGSIYIGMGENLGVSYTMEGADGTRITGGGEGGNVFKLKQDGSGLRLFATGFWNPFELELDEFGRLYTVDNDPDSSPPCRLLLIVDGGDYGYRFRNGRRGLHPFTAWNGELPGTLPMIAGTGEAPSGLLQYDSDQLGTGLYGQLLVTSWGEHRVYQYRTKASGAAVTALRDTAIEGGVAFRPVGIAQATDGSVFISDWVDRDYNLHQKGRVWRLRSKAPTRRVPTESLTTDARLNHADRRIREREAMALAGTVWGRAHLGRLATDRSQPPKTRALALRALAAVSAPLPVGEIAVNDPNPEIRALVVRLFPLDTALLRNLAADANFPEARAEALRRLHDTAASAIVRAAFSDTDPYIRQAALAGAARALHQSELAKWMHDPDPTIRLGSLLTLRAANRADDQAVLTTALVDSDPRVRLAAVQWVAEAGLSAYRDPLVEGMKLESASPRLASAYVVALRKLDEGKNTPDNELPYAPIAARLALDEALPASLRTYALRGLSANRPELSGDRLIGLLNTPHPSLRSEAVRLLAERGSASDIATLRTIATDEQSPAAARSEAIAGLATHAESERALLLDLTKQNNLGLRRQATRSLRGVALTDPQRAELNATQLLDLLSPPQSEPPIDAANAASFLAEPGDAAEGQRVFYHPKGPGCFRCHQIEGRGARIGPDLTTFGQTAGKARVLESILVPSKEVAPHYLSWQFANKDGTIVVGQLIEDRGNEQVYADPQGNTGIIKLSELEARQAMPTSIMPENLAQQMTRKEMRDLVEFLIQTRTPE